MSTGPVDFSKDAGKGFENATRADYIDDAPRWRLYWRVWLDTGIPFALLRARAECRCAGVALPVGMAEALDHVLDQLGQADTATAMLKVVTDERSGPFSMAAAVLQLERDPVLVLIHTAFELPRHSRASDNEVFRWVADLTGSTPAAVKKTWQRYHKTTGDS